MRTKDELLMAECLRLAAKGKGHVSPNPLVGAVLMKNGRIIARGFHRRFGGPHAEVECLRSYRGDLKGTTLYVNLEPCSHRGKTPPCADMIIRSGIRKVVIGMKDPNPLVAGRGIRKLRQSGVRIRSGILEPDAKELNRAFITYVTKRRPFVHVKIAQTLDGKIALRRHSPTPITGKESRILVHQWRAEHDAVVVGVGTIHADDPSLTVRLTKGRNPAAVILDGGFSISRRARVLKIAKGRGVIIFVDARTAREQAIKVKELASKGIRIVPIVSRGEQLPLSTLLRKMYELNIGSVLVEGGGNVFAQFLDEGPIDLLSVFIAPTLFPNGVGVGQSNLGRHSPVSMPVKMVSSRTVGPDVLLQYKFN